VGVDHPYLVNGYPEMLDSRLCHPTVAMSAIHSPPVSLPISLRCPSRRPLNEWSKETVRASPATQSEDDAFRFPSTSQPSTLRAGSPTARAKTHYVLTKQPRITAHMRSAIYAP